MSFSTSKVPTLRTVKAIRGESLTIDLKKTFVGTLTAWMKKDPNDTTFRSFEVIDGRFLKLSKDKASDFFTQTGDVLERVKGKWFFDVEQVIDILKPEDVTTIYRGTIVFANDITNSEGLEVLNPFTSFGLEKVQSFLATSGQVQFIVPEGTIADNSRYAVYVNGVIWNSRTGSLAFPGGNISIDFSTGTITFHFPLSTNDQIIIKYD